MLVWDGHSCPSILKLRLVLMLWFLYSQRVCLAMCRRPNFKSNLKGGGPECPPHTSIALDWNLVCDG
jgi:hypothetical protein